MNFLVFNLKQPYQIKLNGNKSDQIVDYDGIHYRIWVFEDGTFTNQGDGGYMNWAFSGKFKRSGRQGHTVTFEKH